MTQYMYPSWLNEMVPALHQYNTVKSLSFVVCFDRVLTNPYLVFGQGVEQLDRETEFK